MRFHSGTAIPARTSARRFDLVVERQKPLAREREAVVRPELSIGHVDEDLFLKMEQLEHREGVSLAVD